MINTKAWPHGSFRISHLIAKRVLIPALILGLDTLVFGDQIQAPAVPDQTACQVGDWRLGAPFPGSLASDDFRRGSSDIYKPRKAAKGYKLKSRNPRFHDFLVVEEGIVVGIVREFPAEDFDKFLSQLQDNYGEPVPEQDPELKSGWTRDFNVKARKLWKVPTCSAAFELVRLTTLSTQFGPSVGQKTALVVTPYDNESLLK